MDFSGRNLGTSRQASELVGVTPATIRNWLRKGRISAVRVGGGHFLFDLDSVAAMVRKYPLRIDEQVATAPEFTPEQINRIRLLLHTGGGGLDAT